METNNPNISDQARPLKIGSRVIGQAPSNAAAAVRAMGRNRTAPDSRMASFTEAPRSTAVLMKSTRMIPFRTTMPASAIMPIMAVAVKNTGLSNPPTGLLPNAFSSQKPGMMPIMVSGMDSMMMPGNT